MKSAAAELLADYGIDDDVRRPLGTLAVGAQQMVALARAVSTDAQVVIMDEPTSSLEPREVGVAVTGTAGCERRNPHAGQRQGFDEFAPTRRQGCDRVDEVQSKEIDALAAAKGVDDRAQDVAETGRKGRFRRIRRGHVR